MPEPEIPVTPEQLNLMSMRLMQKLAAELVRLNENLTLNRELMKEVRDAVVDNAKELEALGEVLAERLIPAIESVDDVLDIHGRAMEILKDETAGQSRVTLTDYARAWIEAAGEDPPPDGQGGGLLDGPN